MTSRWAALGFVALLAPLARADVTTDQCVDANTKAQSLRRSGKLRDARTQLLICASASCPRMVKDDCTQRMDELDWVMPTIVFQVKDAQGHDLSDVRVTMDGALLADRLVGTALQADVGDHEFSFSSNGYMATSAHYVIVEGQKDRHETITLTSSAPVLVAPPPPPPVETTTPPITPPPPPVTPPPPPVVLPPLAVDQGAIDARRSRRTAGVVLAVFGVLSLGGTVAFAVLGGQQNSTIQKGGFATSSDISSADSTGQAYNVGLGVTLAVGLVLAAIGIPLWLLNLGDGGSARAAALHHVTWGAKGLSLTW